MPIYEYECGRCGSFEHSQSISDKPLSRCPSCGSRKVKRLISASSFHLKGGGWYAQGYQTGDSSGDSPAASKSSTDGDKTGDSGKTGSTATKKAESGTGKSSGTAKKAGSSKTGGSD